MRERDIEVSSHIFFSHLGVCGAGDKENWKKKKIDRIKILSPYNQNIEKPSAWFGELYALIITYSLLCFITAEFLYSIWGLNV